MEKKTITVTAEDIAEATRPRPGFEWCGIAAEAFARLPASRLKRIRRDGRSPQT